MKKIFLVSLLALTAILIAGCIQGPQGPQGDRGDSGPAGSFVQGPNRVAVYQNYLLLDPAAASNTTALAEHNMSSVAYTNTTITQPTYPRNIRLTMNSSGSNTSLVTVVVRGYDLTGDLRNETLTVLNANTTDGNVAFYNITTIYWTGGMSASKQVRLGYGVKFGIPNLIKNNRTDIMAVNIDGTGTAVNLQTINLTYNTIVFSTAPNAARDYVVFYRGYGVNVP